MKIISPTSYPDVNEILNLLLIRVREILSDQLIGMYLFGSLASGDFDRYSDIDVLVVTNNAISDHFFSALESMHTEIAALDNWYSHQLEVSYIPKTALRRYNPRYNQHPHLDRGKDERLQIVQHNSDWVVQRYVLHERGIILAGPEPKTLIDDVSADELRQAMHPVLFGWYAHFLNESNPFGSRGYQSYTVLSLCRILYTLQEGKVVSKLVAAHWAKETLNPRWIPLIERALIGRQNPSLSPQSKDIHETLELIRYALEDSKQTKERSNVGKYLPHKISGNK
jgi:predicted nucleotidyltransferase